jgi:hypothetical protein
MSKNKKEKDDEEKEEREWHYRYERDETLGAEERVTTGLYEMLRSFCADSEHIRNRWAVGQVINSLHIYIEKNNLFSNVRTEDLDDWFREELNFVRNGIREHEEGKG